MPDHDSSRTRRTAAIGPRTLTLRASAPVAGHVVGEIGNLAGAADGTVYVTDVAGLHAFTAELQPRWDVATAGRTPAAPAIRRDGTVVVAASSEADVGRVWAVSAAGVVLWTSDASVTHASRPGTEMSAVAVGCDQTVYVLAAGTSSSGATSWLWAVAADGTLAWKRALPTAWSRPVLGPLGSLYENGPIAINPDGSIWYDDSNGACDWIDRVGGDGTLFHGIVACAADDTRRWAAAAPSYDFSFGATALGADGTLYLPGISLSAVDASGALGWQSARLVSPYPCVSFPVASGIVVDGAGMLYAALGYGGACQGDDGPSSEPPTSMLFMLDGATGEVRASVDLEAAASCAADELALGDHRLYALCADRIVALTE